MTKKYITCGNLKNKFLFLNEMYNKAGKDERKKLLRIWESGESRVWQKGI